jgi:hypothetical protein
LNPNSPTASWIKPWSLSPQKQGVITAIWFKKFALPINLIINDFPLEAIWKRLVNYTNIILFVYLGNQSVKYSAGGELFQH